MPLLRAADAVPCRPQRVLVAGSSGAGKTTLARRIGARLDLPIVEIDALFHGPQWVPRPSFEADVQAFAASPRWVTEWQYSPVRALLAERADLVVWLDLSRGLVLRQVLWRTVVRRLRRTTLWNGNREPPLRTLLTDRQHVVRWAWTTHRSSAARVEALHRDRPDLIVVRLRSRRDVERWADGPLGGVADRPTDA